MNTIEEVKFNILNIKLIVGLGNPGREYVKTRHNAGFIFLDNLKLDFKEEKKFKALVTTFENKNNKVLLAQPLTYMNQSGDSVQSILSYYKIQPQELLVVHDDLDIKLGEYKLQFGKGPKVHNGLISIDNCISTSLYWRLRIGIENRDVIERENFQGADYVLGRFKDEELTLLQETINKIKKDLNI